MPRRGKGVDPSLQRSLAKELFNRTWDLLGKARRTAAEDEEMLYAAYASRYHWGEVGRPVNRAIGEWQLSRVHSVLGRAEPALYHALRSLEIARRHRLSAFYVAYGHEALARAAALSGDLARKRREILTATRLARRIRSQDDRRMLAEDLATVP